MITSYIPTIVTLRETNIDFIQNVNQQFIDSLPKDEDKSWEQVFDDTGYLINFKHKDDGRLLYPTSLDEHENAVLNAFIGCPSRLLMNDYRFLLGDDAPTQTPILEKLSKSNPSSLNLEDIHDINEDIEPSWAMVEIGNYLRANKLQLSQAGIHSEGCALVILGLGSGRCIPHLIQYLKPSALFIVEPDIDILSYSLDTLDYSELIPQFTGTSKAFDFVVAPTPQSAVNQIRSLLTVRNLFLIDGMFTFQSFDTPFVNLTKKLLHSSETLNPINYLGYFIDELHMTMNAVVNYKHLKPKVFNSTKVESNDKHAVICASGPSLASDLEMIKNNREKYAVISCYSTIAKLLDSGIVPDYHCDLERHNDHLLLLDKGIDSETLKDVTLCCSSTCDPRLLGMYKECISINRGALTPSVIFSESNDIIPNEGPDVATFAILSAIFLGFRTLHLFGVDLGTADRSQCRLPGVLDIDRRVYNIPARGNQGKTVFTGQLLIDNRLAIEQNISLYSGHFPDLKVLNYSDGVYINGAIPTKPSEFASIIKSAPSFSGLSHKFVPYSETHVSNSWEVADLRMRSFTYIENLRSIKNDPFLMDNLYKVSDLSNAAGKSYQDQIPIRFYRGSMFRTWIMLVGVYNRLVCEDHEREAFEEFSKKILDDIFDSFQNLTFEMIDYVETIDSVDDFTMESKLFRSDPDTKPLVMSASVAA